LSARSENGGRCGAAGVSGAMATVNSSPEAVYRELVVCIPAIACHAASGARADHKSFTKGLGKSGRPDFAKNALEKALETSTGSRPSGLLMTTGRGGGGRGEPARPAAGGGGGGASGGDGEVELDGALAAERRGIGRVDIC